MASSGNNGERQRLEELRRYDILDTPDEPAFDGLVALAAQICNAPVSLISFVDGDREWIKSRVGTDLHELSSEHAFAKRAVNATGLIVVADAEKDDDLRKNPFVTNEPHAHYFAGLALVDSTGTALGALYVLDTCSHDLTERQQTMLRVLGQEAVTLLELRREVYESRQRSNEILKDLEQSKAQLQAECMERTRSEEVIKRHEQQLADAQRITHLGSWEWDLRSNRIIWSDELFRIYGLKPHEFEPTYEAYLRFVHPDDRGRTNMAVEQALMASGSFANEERIVRRDGEIRTLFSCGEVIKDDRNIPVRMVGCCRDITKRKATQRQLQHTVSLLNATIEATADAVLVVDSDRKVVQFNNNFVELWNFPPDAVRLFDDKRLLSMVVSRLRNPDAFCEKVEKMYTAPDASSFDVLEFNDGRTIERFSCPQRLGDRIVGRVWSFRDVTERVQAVRVLRQSEERYRSLVQATAQVVWTAAPDGQILQDSPSWRAYTGQRFAQMKGSGWLNAVHPRDRARVVELWRHSVATGTGYQLKMRIRRFDSEWRHVSVRGVPVREADGKIREWVGFGLDITERVLAKEAIVKERDFSDAILSSLPGIFYLLDENGLNLRWNKNLETVTGYSAREIAKMRAIDFVAEEERALVAERVHKVFATGEAEVTLNLLCKSGARVPYYCTGKLVHLENGPRLIGAGIDISELKRAEAEINRLNSELEERVKERTHQLNEANREMSTFTYTASHDLRSPIRAIVGFARAIREDSAHLLNEENRLYLDRIIEASDRMMQLIDDLLQYSSAGKQVVHVRPVHLAETFSSILHEFEPRLKSVGGDVVMAASLPRVLGDPTLLNQIFANLIENAVTYRRPNSHLKIDIGWRVEGDNVVVSIRDNGIGIAPQHQQRIFEVFQRLHGNDVYPGTGIGLATVKRAAEKLNGAVWVESELGRGSTFLVRLKSAVKEA
jgi:PAS domain S-box-containing protein